MNPIFDVLLNNSSTILQESDRFKAIYLNGWEGQPTYNPRRREITFMVDRMNDFNGQWAHLNRLFKAQDAFGSVNFRFAYGDKAGLAAMDMLLANKETLKPYFNRIPMYDFEFSVDDESHTSNIFKEFRYGKYKSLIVDPRFDLQYILNVFGVYFKMLDLRMYLGEGVIPTGYIYAIAQHKECFSKILSIKDTLIKKLDRIEIWFVDVGIMSDHTYFNPKDAELTLYCGDSAEKMEEVVNAIP